MKPRVSLNLALSADGKISDAKRRPSGWTSRKDHQRLLDLRVGADALLVGRATWLADRMTLRAPGAERPPLRCIVSRHGDLPADHPIFSSAGGDIHVLCTEDRVSSIPRPDVTYHTGTLAHFLHTLASDYGVRHLHCEGGGHLVGELMRLHAVDQVHITLAGHTLFGGFTAPTATGLPGGPSWLGSEEWKITHYEADQAHGECYLTYERSDERAGRNDPNR